ncbi:MAG: glycosyltransferase, partial [Bryobacteraceae bacterium]
GEDLSYVLYGSGGCSLYAADKLRALGSVDEIYEPAYVEDLDLGYRGWQRGWPTVFAAGARVLHAHRATTSRYYTEAELERVLEVNYLRFLARAIASPRLFRRLWRAAVWRLNALCAGEPRRIDALAEARHAAGWVEQQPLAAGALPEELILAIGSGQVAVFPGRPPRGKPRILIASPYAAFPLSHGGAVRMYNLMQRAAEEFDLVLVRFADQWTPPLAEMLAICMEIVLVQRVGTHWLPSRGRPDAVEEFDSPAFHAALRETVRKWRPAIAQIEFTQMAAYAGDCAGTRTILVEHDITFDLYAQMLKQKDDWETRREWKRWARFERAAWKHFDCVVTMSEKDRRTVTGVRSVCLPNGVDLERFRPSGGAPEPDRLLFIGSFAHFPNVLAIEFFLREAWPELARRGARLHIIAGSRHRYFLERHRTHLDLDQPGIEVEDFVSDVRPAYERAMVAIAPLVASAGTNIKIVEAMVMGKAIVSTPAGVNGLDVTPGRDVVIARTGPEMAGMIASLLDHPEERQTLEREARHTVERQYDWDAIARQQAELYHSLRATTE